MTGPSLKTLVGIIQEAAMSHPTVKSFGTGERHEISLDGGTVPTLVWLEQPFLRSLLIPERGSPTRRFRIQMLVLDLCKEDKSDELDILSRCDLIADWIVLKLIETDDLTIGNEVSVLSLTAYHGDLWNGVRVEMEITTALPLGACDVRGL